MNRVIHNPFPPVPTRSRERVPTPVPAPFRGERVGTGALVDTNTERERVTPQQDALIPTPHRASTRTKKTHPHQNLATRHPDGIRATWCPKCKQPVLTGYDDLACAFWVRVDPTPLTRIGEALAVLAGRHTYELRQTRPPRIIRRTASSINARPADTTAARSLGAYDVVADHECHHTPVDACSTRSRLAEPPPASAPLDTPPY